MKERIFKFKQFNVSHLHSAMKVGVDAVLLGAWTDVEDKKYIVDIGTGCGVIALAMAQRTKSTLIDAIDIDPPSVAEACDNFKNSLWANRLHCQLASFNKFIATTSKRYDLIISNPPFYDSGITTPTDARERSRHIGELSPFSLITEGVQLLNKNGSIALIAPAEMEKKLLACASKSGLFLKNILRIKGNAAASTPKRVMIEFSKIPISPPLQSDTLVIQTNPGMYTQEYIALTQDFYLKF